MNGFMKKTKPIGYRKDNQSVNLNFVVPPVLKLCLWIINYCYI